MSNDDNIQDIYELGPMQLGMLYHSIMDKHSGAYVVQSELNLEGNIDLEILEKSFNKIIDRYDTLRTIFIYEDLDTPLQIVLKNRNIKINYHDISSSISDVQNIKIKDYKSKERYEGFDLSKDNLTKITLFKRDKQKYCLLWSFHHILMDGWCTTILLRDLLIYYSSIKKGEDCKLPLTNNYRSYIDWLKLQDKDEALKFWAKYLDNFEGANSFPKKSNSKLDYIKGCFSLELDSIITEKLIRFSSKYGITQSVILQTIWGILLQRYNNSNDVVFGTVISGRTSEIENIEEMVGLFINTIPVRIKTESTDTFKSLVNTIQGHTIEIKKYEYSLLAEIQSLTEKGIDLIDHIIGFQNFAINDGFKEISSGNSTLDLGFSIAGIYSEEQTNYNLDLIISPGTNLVLTIDYNKNIYDDYIISNALNHFNNILEHVLDNADVLLNELELITTAEKEIILHKFNNTITDYPKEKTIHQLFEEQVERNPENIALVFDNRHMSYKELNEKSNQLGKTLRDKGIRPDKVIGLMVDRSFEMIIGIIGILKAGGVYLPIDLEYPEDRKLFMLENSNAFLLLKNSITPNISEYKGDILLLDDNKIYLNDTSNLPIINKSTDLAYIIYTSGTTGNPKGVMLEHKGIVNLNQVFSKDYNINSKDNVLQFARNTFDASVWEIFMTLFNGAKLFLLKGNNLINYSEFILENKINVLTLPPFIINDFDDSVLRQLRIVISAGSSSTTNLIEKCKNHTRYINAYGPTEDSICTTYCDYSKFNSPTVTIGKPIANRKIYIVNSSHLLQPIGVAGELIISGEGLARGYINRDDLTKEKFIYWEPESGKTYSNDDKPESAIRVYRTGDLCRLLPDGNIEFLGRIDHQVKIRGFRIELTEIENRLNKHESVKESLIIAKDFGYEQKELVAYIVLNGINDNPDINIFREFIKKTLPAYMVPSFFVFLESLPMNMNGKVDRKLLPNPSFELSSKTYVAPKNEIEQKIAIAWQKVLHIEKISTTDNFFEIGGNSIKAIQMAANSQDTGLSIDIKDIFQYQTIEQLSNHYQALDRSNNTMFASDEQNPASLSDDINTDTLDHYDQNEILQILKRIQDEQQKFDLSILLQNEIDSYSTSGMQKVHLFMGSINTMFSIHLNHPIDRNIFEKVFHRIIKQQSVLRCRLVKNNDRFFWREHNASPSLASIPYVDLSTKPKQIHHKIIDEINKELYRINFVESGSLMYCLYLVKHSEIEYSLQIIASHLIADLMSFNILKNNIDSGYHELLSGNEMSLPQIKPYKDYINQVQLLKLPKPEEIESIFEVYEFCKNLEEANKTVIKQYITAEGLDSGNLQRQPTSMYNIVIKNVEEKDVWDVSFYEYCKILKIIFNSTKIQVFLLSFGRKFGNDNYFNTIGEFLDLLPIQIDLSSNDEHKIIETVNEKRNYINQHSLSFINTIFSENNNDKKWQKISSAFKPLFSNKNHAFSVFNFLGKFSNEEYKYINETSEKVSKMNPSLYIECAVKYTNEELLLTIFSPFAIDESVFHNSLMHQSQ